MIPRIAFALVLVGWGGTKPAQLAPGPTAPPAFLKWPVVRPRSKGLTNAISMPGYRLFKD